MSTQPEAADFAAFPGPTSVGMTMRDVVAVHFMAARIANPTGNTSLTDYDMAVFAYQRADAFLRARAATQTGGER